MEPIRGVADSGRFSDDLAALFEVLGEAARDLGVGVLILIDELQDAPPQELAALNTAVHDLGQAAVPLPVMVVELACRRYRSTRGGDQLRGTTV